MFARVRGIIRRVKQSILAAADKDTPLFSLIVYEPEEAARLGDIYFRKITAAR